MFVLNSLSFIASRLLPAAQALHFQLFPGVHDEGSQLFEIIEEFEGVLFP